MSPQKRIVLLTALIGLALIGSTARGEAQGRGRIVIMGGYYADPFWFYDPWWGYQRAPYPYPPYGFVYSGAALRLEVKPKEAEVYLDGYYAGIVDDFDGVFQRLRTAAGDHDLTLYRDGYRAITQHIYLTPGSTLKVKYTMERLAPGEAAQPRPVPPNQPAAVQPGPIVPFRGPDGPRPPSATLPVPPRVEGAPGASGEQPAGGTLEIRVQPGDADIVIDGQPLRFPDGQDRIVIDMSEGRHIVQLRKAGYVGYLTEVQVRRGETTTLNVSLRTQS